MKRFALLLIALVVIGDSALAQRRGGGPPPDQAQGLEGGRGEGRGGRGATPRDPVPRNLQTAGTAVLQGHVLSADTGAPIPRAEVRATSSSSRSARVTATDANGRFVLLDLQAGSWTVTVSKGGYVTQPYGQRRPFEVVEPIELTQTERRTLTFTMWRGGAISGEIYDEFGAPMTGARVQLLRAQTVNGERRLSQAGMTDQTDDRGRFRLFGLAPGEYYVTATARATALAGGPATYAPTYYPGTPHAAEAQRIFLSRPGEEATATFTVVPVPVAQVAGLVISSGGVPASATINLRPATGNAIVGPGATFSGSAGSDGRFTIANVVPGTYLLNATTRGRGGRGRGGEGRGGAAATEMASVLVNVGPDGVGGVIVTTGPGASVSGTVVGSGGDPPTSGLRLVARGQRGGRNVQATVSDEGTVRLTGLLGGYTFDVERLPDGWMLDSIAIGGVDASQTPMELRGTEQISGVQIVLTNRLTEATGRVTLRGQPVADAHVVVFPDDASRWALPARFLRVLRGDAQGAFTVSALPPGRYLAVAVNYLQEGEFQSREFLDSMRPRAASFSLGAGAAPAIELGLVER